MKIFFDNVNFSSPSGPNSFANKLAVQFQSLGHSINDTLEPDLQLTFISSINRIAPIVQRLDGIYFNSEQDWQKLNEPIRETYKISAGVIFQSDFNKRLTEHYFGPHSKSAVIHNGTDLEEHRNVPFFTHAHVERFEKVWAAASSWRPHKRLAENIRYFLEHSVENECMIIAGENPDAQIKHPRVFYAGNLPREKLISLYKRADYFIHLALMDHCPNVVIDARAAGCHIICASSGGTKEIAGKDATIIEDAEWDFRPFALYDPPQLDFSKRHKNAQDSNININRTAQKYLKFFEEALR
jgi:glycosyltransferase involved in cell wall biosynthesis